MPRRKGKTEEISLLSPDSPSDASSPTKSSISLHEPVSPAAALDTEEIEVVESFAGVESVAREPNPMLSHAKLGDAFVSEKMVPCCGFAATADLVLLTWEGGLPPYLKDNGYIRSGYRAGLTVREALWSIFAFHNETGNIWTHGLGCLFFLVLLVCTHLYVLRGFPLLDHLLFTLFFLSVCSCLFFSTTFHTLLATRESIFLRASRLDYSGIALLVVGSFAPIVYYGFYCDRTWLIIYQTLIGVVFVVALVVCNLPKFESPEYRTTRASVFTAFGLLGIVPLVHHMAKYGASSDSSHRALLYILLEAFFYLFGAALYAARVPEKLKPGLFDRWFMSHQIFHVCVVLGAGMHYMALLTAVHQKYNNPMC